jgi:hypothetical protein
MRDSVYAGSLRRFVKGTEGVAQRLEFADEFGGDRWPMSGDIVSLRRLLDDLRAVAVYRGRTGASDYGLAAQVVEQLTAVAEAHDAGDLAPWRSCRGSVLESVASLRQLCQPEHDELVVRSAVPAAPALWQAMPEEIDQEQYRGDKGHKGEKGPVVVLSGHEEKMLRVLLAYGATSENDRFSKENVMFFGRMKREALRNAAKWLAQKGLIESFSDRRGGYWLTPDGLNVARNLPASQKK